MLFVKWNYFIYICNCKQSFDILTATNMTMNFSVSKTYTRHKSKSCLIAIFKLFAICIILLSGLTACNSTKKISSRPGNPEIEEIHIKKSGKKGKKIIDEAYTWLGTPYKYAGAEKGKGTDCSGLVMKVYETATGEKIPRNSARQAEYCTRIDAADVDAGDLVFFATGKNPQQVSHVGIVIDSESFIHASSSKGVVVSKFANNYYQRTFLMYGRVPSNR